MRIDGRDTATVRPIAAEVGILPRAHGSALFTRGETQALVVTTLGTGQDEQIIDALEKAITASTSCCTTTSRPTRSARRAASASPGRREIGHGKLAWRAIRPLLPAKEDFPYTMRVVSEITESNGSSSMATVCGTSLSLMDAGVPLPRPVAGIAMGLIKEDDASPFCPTFSATRITWATWTSRWPAPRTASPSLQMDIKITSITEEIMKVALGQAKDGRMHILGEMAKALIRPRACQAIRAADHHLQHSEGQDPRSDRHRRQGDPRDLRDHRRQDRHRRRRHHQGRRRRRQAAADKAIDWIRPSTRTRRSA
jgi:polyribonucleotide nucleotidyltransferase